MMGMIVIIFLLADVSKIIMIPIFYKGAHLTTQSLFENGLKVKLPIVIG